MNFKSTLSEVYDYVEKLSISDLIVFYLAIYIFSNAIKLILKSDIAKGNEKVNPNFALSVIFVYVVGGINMFLVEVGITFENYIFQFASCTMIFIVLLYGGWRLIFMNLLTRYYERKNTEQNIKSHKELEMKNANKNNEYKLNTATYEVENKIAFKNDRREMELMLIKTAASIISIFYFATENLFVALGMYLVSLFVGWYDVKRLKFLLKELNKKDFKLLYNYQKR